MPSAISRPSEPVDTVSISIDLSFLPSRMIEPLPKLRSIGESAASRAFDLSIDEPSTRRSAAAVAIAPTPYDRDSDDRQRMLQPVDRAYTICSSFAICSFAAIEEIPKNRHAVPQTAQHPISDSPRV